MVSRSVTPNAAPPIITTRYDGTNEFYLEFACFSRRARNLARRRVESKSCGKSFYRKVCGYRTRYLPVGSTSGGNFPVILRNRRFESFALRHSGFTCKRDRLRNNYGEFDNLACPAVIADLNGYRALAAYYGLVAVGERKRAFVEAYACGKVGFYNLELHVVRLCEAVSYRLAEIVYLGQFYSGRREVFKEVRTVIDGVGAAVRVQKLHSKISCIVVLYCIRSLTYYKFVFGICNLVTVSRSFAYFDRAFTVAERGIPLTAADVGNFSVRKRNVVTRT